MPVKNKYIVMTYLILESHIQLYEIVLWGLGILLVIALVAAVFWQQRIGRSLVSELEQLEAEKKKDIEYDFVLRAMGLSVWHINTDDGVLCFDKDFRERRLEFTEGKDGGNIDDNADLLIPEDAKRVSESLGALCAGEKEDYHEQYRVRIPGSNRVYWEESYATIAKRDIDGRPLVVVGTTQRIDNRKELETALKSALAKAEESDRLKSAFIANMSHEIRTPLNAIIGFTSVLPDIDGKSERQELINLIQENNQKLLRIIDDVMTISKIEAGKEKLQPVTFDVNLIIDELINKYIPNLSSGVTLSAQYAAQQQDINTDLTRFMECVEHLISNAVKFTSQGSIVVGYDAVENHRLRLWVRDTGKGIAPENHERVFERFFKVDEFIPGAGLGLSLCRTIAYSLGGNVGVESKLGEGSTFWLEIPV